VRSRPKRATPSASRAAPTPALARIRPRMDPEPPSEAPTRVVALDQRLGRLHDVSRGGDPIEVRNHGEAVGSEDPGDLARGRGAVEPVPALSRCDHVGRRRVEAGFLRPRHAVIDLHARLRVERSRLGEHARVGVDCDHRTPAPREPAGQGARPGAEIDELLTRKSDSPVREPLEEGVGEAGAMPAVVVGCRAEVGPQVAHAGGAPTWTCTISAAPRSGGSQ
jgi:hypothetical protein